MRKERKAIEARVKDEQEQQEMEEAQGQQEYLLQKHVGHNVRTMEDFLSDQIGYEERKVQKLQELAH